MFSTVSQFTLNCSQKSPNEPYYVTPSNINKLDELGEYCSNKNCTVHVLVAGNEPDWINKTLESLFSNETNVSVFVIDWKDIQTIHGRKQRSLDYAVNYVNKTVKSLSDYLKRRELKIDCIGNGEPANRICNFMNNYMNQNKTKLSAINEHVLENNFCKSSSVNFNTIVLERLIFVFIYLFYFLN